MNDLSSWVGKNAAFTPSKTAIRFEGEDIDYARFAEMVRGHARALKSVHGVGRGDRVAFLGFNSPSMLALFFACARIGAMFLPLNWRLVAPELAYILGDSAPRILVADAGHADLAREAAAGCPETAVIPVDRIARDAETAKGEDLDPEAGPETPCLLVYTSGTTGHPKGAVLDQRAIQVNALNCIHYAGLTDADRVLTVLPMFHVGGLNILTSPAFHAGGTVILHRRFEPEAVLRAIVGGAPDAARPGPGDHPGGDRPSGLGGSRPLQPAFAHHGLLHRAAPPDRRRAGARHPRMPDLRADRDGAGLDLPETGGRVAQAALDREMRAPLRDEDRRR